MNKSISIGLGIAAIAALVLVFVVGSFYAGMVYQKNQKTGTATIAQAAPNGSGFGNGQGFPPGGQGFSRGFGGGSRGGVSGTVDSVSGNNVTVKTSDGSTKTVTISDSTTITKSQQVSASDLTAGQTVLVMGATNSDGSVTARNITIR